jgi:hypothetical protein
VVRFRSFAWLVLVVVGTPAMAQGPSRLLITVSDQLTGAPIPGAQVALRVARVGGLTDSLGQVALDVSPGTDTLEVRFLGYASSLRPIDLDRGGAHEIDIQLAQEAVTLPKITVAGSGVVREPGLGFSRRQKIGLGHFVTRADIERFRPTTSSDILRRVPGVRVRSNRAGDHVISMMRSTSRCRVQYYVDNVAMPTEELLDAAIEQRVRAAEQNGGTAAQTRSKKLNRDLPSFTIDHIAPEMIEAIEVYRGAAEIPIEYRTTGSLCGVVLIWTRTGT